MTTTARSARDERAARVDGGARFWVGVAIGWVIMGLAIRGLLGDSDAAWREWGRWFIGSALLHDFLIAPIVAVVAVVVLKVVPARLRAPVQGGLLATGAVLLFAWPLLRGYGKRADNFSVLPRDYADGVFKVLAVVWTTVVVVAIVSYVRSRSSEGDQALAGTQPGSTPH